MSSQSVFLLDKRTGQSVEAQLVEGVEKVHLLQVASQWKPVVARHISDLIARSAQTTDWPQSSHWDWDKKMSAVGSLLAYRSFAIVCEGRLEGLMIANTAGHRAQEKSQAGQHLVYIDFVETAPWNRSSITSAPEFGGIGTIFIRAAIQVSRDEGFQGRIGLHSLPQSEEYYRRCQMSDLGIDGTKENLRYFEMTSEQSDAFLS